MGWFAQIHGSHMTGRASRSSVEIVCSLEVILIMLPSHLALPNNDQSLFV